MFRFIFLIFLLLTSLFSNEKVTLQLKWFHQFQFAGYYAAKEKGFYNDVGLDVELKQRDLKYNNIQEVIDGKAQYGIADSVLFLYKSKNEPVILLAPIFQHSSNVLISLKNSGINSIYDFDKRNMIFYPNDTDGFSILALLKKFDLKPNLIRKRTKDDYLKLINKDVDISPAYLSNEPFYFKQRNIDINIINPMNYGFDLYGDMLFTNEDEVLNHYDRVNRFKDASLKGWNYALENKEEIIKLIHEKYNSKKSIEHLRYEANVIENLINKNSITLGTIDKGRVKYINELYKEYGLISKTSNIKDFIFKDYNEKYSNLNFTKEEKEFLKNHPVLKVQGMESYAPYNFTEKGKNLGYTVDYFNLFARYLGIDIEFITESWSKHLNKLKTGELDISPHIAMTQERKKFVEYTNINDIDFIPTLVVRRDMNISSLDDLKGKTLAVLKNSFLEKIIRKHFKDIIVIGQNTTAGSLELVSSGKADAVIEDLSSVQYFIKKNWFTNLKTIRISDYSFFKKTPLYIGVSKNSAILKSIIEKVDNIIPIYEKIDLKNKWVGTKTTKMKKFMLNQEEINFLKNKKNLLMCVNPN
ncbi:MAG: hypothetical protein C0625_12840 [Arcobacter sp.]|nr:MAG: hypothetical protein C0625_12840 [Arcobacter sp.]